MAIRMEKPWLMLDAANVAPVPGQLGVFQLADAAADVVAIGYAGGRSLFGLRGALMDHLAAPPAVAVQFRYEVNTQYLTRYRELLMLHVADHGELPLLNREDPPANLGRLSPL